ncbi:MAG: 16S rRNA (cytosine(1402)-N(4))-methyltransferase RsmH [Candidatus Berkelbacteria bacterium]|nr:16S rRNA (cytosine(1402)-N(4))-methyltransferase RsmH [Candidatus Berkelbacteria bacterium]
MIHRSVLSSELIQYLNPRPNQNFIDATVGLGGHAQTILSKTKPSGKVLCIDQDKKAISYISKINNKRLVPFLGNFKNMKSIAEKTDFSKVSGVYFDLGLGSWQISDPEYGLSFKINMSLNMKFQDTKSEFQDDITAKDVVNRFSEKQLTEILHDYGEVIKPYQIARKIVKYRQKQSIKSTFELVEACGVKNPAVLAKIFQALRIYVNDELASLQEALLQALGVLEKRGKIVVISYHSGEDRIVKNFFKEKQKDGIIKILTKKPINPSSEEVKENIRARSAKLRAVEKA